MNQPAHRTPFVTRIIGAIGVSALGLCALIVFRSTGAQWLSHVAAALLWPTLLVGGAGLLLLERVSVLTPFWLRLTIAALVSVSYYLAFLHLFNSWRSRRRPLALLLLGLHLSLTLPGAYYLGLLLQITYALNHLD